MTEEIKISESDNILTVTICRPGKKNAINTQMYEALSGALDLALKQPKHRVVIFQGLEGIFCAGNDIMDFVQNPPQDASHPVMVFLESLSIFPKPLIAAVDGPAVGIGTTMLLHTDLVYATERAQFSLPFTSLGLVPEAASSYLLPRLFGLQKASEYLLLGTPFSAEKASQLGLVNDVFSDFEVMSEFVMKQASKLAALPASALRTAKQLIRQPHTEPVHKALVQEASAFAAALGSPEASEAFQAFLEKRTPNFKQFD